MKKSSLKEAVVGINVVVVLGYSAVLRFLQAQNTDAPVVQIILSILLFAFAVLAIVLNIYYIAKRQSRTGVKVLLGLASVFMLLVAYTGIAYIVRLALG